MAKAVEQRSREAAEPRSLRRRLIIGVALLPLFCVALGPHLAYRFSADYDLEDAYNEAERLDPGWRTTNHAHKPLSNDKNGAVEVISAYRVLPEDFELPFNLQALKLPHTPNLDQPEKLLKVIRKTLDNLAPPIQLNAQQLNGLENQLATCPTALERARRMLELSTGSYANLVEFEEIRAKKYAFLFKVAYLLEADSLVSSQRGDCNVAIRSCHAILNVARSIGDTPDWPAQWYARGRIQAVALDSLQRSLAQGQASSEDLLLLQRALEEEDREPTVLRGARAYRVWLDDKWNAGTSVKKKVNLSSWEQIRGWYVQHDKRKHAEDIKTMNTIVEAYKQKPLEQLVVPHDSLASVVLGSGIRPHRAFARAAIVGLAMERYRLDFNRWPDSADDLVPKYLSIVPLDPFIGKPLRIRRLQDGIVTYSVGHDCKDDGGKSKSRIEREEYYPPFGGIGWDIGFRLWDLELRRQPPLPPIPIPQGNRNE